MAEKEKVTIMVLKVDLQCHKCCKKVKRVLCKFPQIRDQIYDEKQNQVVIKVVCCSPEKIRDMICCKGGGAIKSIEIKEPEKPKPPPPKEPPPKPAPAPEKPKDPPPKPAPEKPKDPPPKPAPVPVCYPPPYPVTVNVCCTDCYHGHHGGPCKTGPAPAPEKPKETPTKPAPAPVPVGYPPPYPDPVTVNVCCTDCYHGHHGGPCKTGPAPAPEKPKETPTKPAPAPVPVGYPPPYPDPVTVNVCCTDCYHGHHGGPCETGCGGIAPYIQYDGCYGRPVYDSYGGGRSNNSNYCVARSDCFSEENPQGCTVM